MENKIQALNENILINKKEYNEAKYLLEESIKKLDLAKNKLLIQEKIVNDAKTLVKTTQLNLSLCKDKFVHAKFQLKEEIEQRCINCWSNNKLHTKIQDNGLITCNNISKCNIRLKKIHNEILSSLYCPDCGENYGMGIITSDPKKIICQNCDIQLCSSISFSNMCKQLAEEKEINVN